MSREEYATLGWLRRRRFRNSLVALWRRSKVLLIVLGASSVLLAFPLALLLSVPASPPASVPERTGAWASILIFDGMAWLYLPALGAVLGFERPGERELLYTSPIARTSVIRERSRSVLVGSLITSCVLGLLGGLAIRQGFGLPLASSAFLFGVETFGFLPTLVLVFDQARLWVGGLSAKEVDRLALAFVAVLVVGAGVGFHSSWTTGNLSWGDPAPWLLREIAQAQAAFLLQTGFGPFVLLVNLAPWAALAGLVVFISRHEYWPIPSDPGRAGPLQEGIEAAPRSGAFDRLRRWFRPRYRDLGSGDRALRGLALTLVLRSGGLVLVAVALGLVATLGVVFSLSAPPSSGPPGGFVFVPLGMGSLFTMFIGMIGASGGPGLRPVVEQARLGPYRPAALVTELSRTGLLCSGAFGVAVGALTLAESAPFALVALVGLDIFILGLAMQLGQIGSALGASGPPATNVTSPTTMTGRSAGLMMAVAMLGMIEATAAVFILGGFNAWAQGLAGTGALLGFNAVLAVLFWRRAVRAARLGG
jgi:hypothetical protein